MLTLRTPIVGLCCIIILFVNADESCLTPDRVPGNCVDVRKCTSIINMLSKKPLTTTEIAYIKSFQCGLTSNGPKVCCPQSNPSVPNKNSTFISTSEIKGTSLLPDLTDCRMALEYRIIGGTIALLGEHPWLALLQYDTDKGSSFRCGGVLINTRYVLTAAHCIRGDKYAKWTLKSVRLGEQDISKEIDCEEDSGFPICSEPPIDVEVEKIIVHDQFDESKPEHDIALIRLAKNVTYTEYVKPICLEKSDVTFRNINFGVAAVGWGLTENGPLTDKKSRNYMHINYTESCQYPELASNSSNYICSFFRTNEYPTYYGDTGGSLERQSDQGAYYAVGIMWSRHPQNFSESGTIIYTKVKEDIPWILKNLEA